jgi:hypothetical protein
MPHITPPSQWDTDENTMDIPKVFSDTWHPSYNSHLSHPDSNKYTLPDKVKWMPENAADQLPLDFGKYRGKTLEQILKTDPGYLVWIHDHTERGIVSEELYKQAKELYVPRSR